MKLSKNFLNDYIDINDKDFKEVAEKMLFMGNEYDFIKPISTATNLVIGKVLTRVDHPNSNKLNICEVDIGDNKTHQIVCGANNVDAGQNVIVAKVGATLPGDLTIKKTNIRGEESNGMICSLSELGIDNKFLTKEDIEGIHILDPNAPLGKDAIKYLGYDDEVIHFDLTTNRSDLLSMIGMAYEVGAIYDLDVNYPKTSYKEINKNVEDNFELTIKTNNCEKFLIKKASNIQIKESPQFIKNRLIANGIRPINNIVDISNYVMLETGQPLHFYDANKLGNKILVRMANENEKIITLDKKERNLTNNDIVITNGKNVVGIAGVMGGFDTEVSKETTDIIIESAIFNPVNIRNTAKKAVRSEASTRFEKGINKEMTEFALKRACYLLEKYANANIWGGIVSHDKTTNKTIEIEVALNHINKILGTKLSNDEVKNVFNKLKFNYYMENDIYYVTIPSRRLDLNIAEDLIEEVGRVIGFNNIEGILPKLTVKKGSYSNKILYLKNVRKRLESLGLQQVITYSLVSKEMNKMFVNHKFEQVKLKEPISVDKSIMRTSLIPSLLNVFNYNNARNIENINIFEIGSIYYKENDKYIEKSMLAGLLSGTYITNDWQKKHLKVDFYLAKGIIENILQYLGLTNRYSFVAKQLNDMHPNRCAVIKVGMDEVGYIGEVHPGISNKRIYIFELNLDKLICLKTRNIKFKEISKYPTITKDVAFVVNKQTISDDIVKVIRKSGGRLLTNIDVFDVYEGTNIENNKKSIAYTLQFSDMNRTLIDEEVNIIFEKIIKDVENKIGAKLRDR